MGAYMRWRERKIERQLRDDATKGVRSDWSGRSRGDDEFRPPDVPDPGISVSDRRALIPPLGLREYWYPALPVRKVPRHRPMYWKMLGDELVVFRTATGGIAALSDVCPHRGASLSKGDCFYRGTVTCPYHGATFDGTGACAAFLTEGPDSKMVGNLSVRMYPVEVRRGWVFLWMGKGEPVALEDDIPPEFFEPITTMIQSTYTYWPTSWIVAIENQNDAHNAFFVHRNSLMNLTADRNRRRTPIGPRSKLINDAALLALMQNQDYYARDGVVPYQLRYDLVGGVWPLGKWRKVVWTAFRPWYKYGVFSNWHKKLAGFPYEAPEEWSPQPGHNCWHLPSAVRVNHGYWTFNRYAVPVSADLSRIVYFHTRRTRSVLARAWRHVWFRLYFNWWMNYNFSGQDNGATSPCRYWTEENLAPTDSHLILLRKLITERSRDVKRRAGRDVAITTDAEARAYRLEKDAGSVVESDLDSAAAAEAADGPVDMSGLGRWLAGQG